MRNSLLPPRVAPKTSPLLLSFRRSCSIVTHNIYIVYQDLFKNWMAAVTSSNFVSRLSSQPVRRSGRPHARSLSRRPAWFPGQICILHGRWAPIPDGNYPIEMIAGVPVVAAPAEIDVTTADQLRLVLLEAAANGHTTTVVDMTGTQFCDSAGLGVLVRAHKRALELGGELRLVIPAAGTVSRIFTLTSLYRFIPRFDSLPEALRQRPAAAIRPSRPHPAPGLGRPARRSGSPEGGVRAGG